MFQNLCDSLRMSAFKTFRSFKFRSRRLVAARTHLFRVEGSWFLRILCRSQIQRIFTGALRSQLFDFMTVQDNVTKFKVVLLGDAGVGKTSLMMRLTDPDFNPRAEVDPTCDVDEAILRIQSRRGSKFQIHISDTAGEEVFRKMTSSYFRNAHAVLLVFDLSRPETLEAVRDVWHRDCESYASEAILILVGNKSDLPPAVPEESVLGFAEENGLLYLTASSYDGPDALGDLKKQLISHLSSSPNYSRHDDSMRKSEKKIKAFSIRKSLARFR